MNLIVLIKGDVLIEDVERLIAGGMEIGQELASLPIGKYIEVAPADAEEPLARNGENEG